MEFLFISRERYKEMVSLKDRRIAELEAERRMLWDKVCLLGIGAPMFAPVAKEELKQESEAQNKAEKTKQPVPTRPSAIMRRMDRLAEARWLRKMYPSRAAGHDIGLGQQ
jgi:hypothetical protein